MQSRVDYHKLSPGGYKAMLGLEHYLGSSTLEKGLLHMIKLRVSQLNGCAFVATCIGKTLRRKVKMGSACTRSMPGARLRSTRKRNAPRWRGAEAVTNVTEGHVPDEVYEETREHFSEPELADLTLALVTINAWNRLSIAFRVVPGTYQVPQKLGKETMKSGT